MYRFLHFATVIEGRKAYQHLKKPKFNRKISANAERSFDKQKL